MLTYIVGCSLVCRSDVVSEARKIEIVSMDITKVVKLIDYRYARIRNTSITMH